MPTFVRFLHICGSSSLEPQALAQRCVSILLTWSELASNSMLKAEVGRTMDCCKVGGLHLHILLNPNTLGGVCVVGSRLYSGVTDCARKIVQNNGTLLVGDEMLVRHVMRLFLILIFWFSGQVTEDCIPVSPPVFYGKSCTVCLEWLSTPF